MKNFQKTVLILALLTLAGCSLNRPTPALAFPDFKAPPRPPGVQPSRKQQRRQPLQLHLPETETQPSTIVNIYEGHQVETSGAAEVRHHPNGMEIAPSIKPELREPRTLPNNSAHNSHPKINSPTTPPKPASIFEFSKKHRLIIGFVMSCIGVFGLGYAARRPIIKTVKNADLSDGIGDELKELATEVPAELIDQFKEFMRSRSAGDAKSGDAAEVKPTRKRTAKKKTTK